MREFGTKKTIKEEVTDLAIYDASDEQLVPVTEKVEYDELCKLCNSIAYPIAKRKLAKKIYKLVKEASKEKGYVRQGISDVQKAIRRDEKGIVILAGNVQPIDVYSHIPAWCEEKDLPYIFTPSREHLGFAMGHKRAVIILFIRKHEEYSELYEYVKEAIKIIPPPEI
ncbi:unnamed protein product [Dracunculus medinensis]|uniref:Ribosomal_L7Ae domain-containing protein n=1 Tax=Dracunculus medinensis TaxID=318479 RepID=A0A0N4U8U4_DRAME|nr:unnamed protein product [Dracunculus medinensis]